MFEPGEGVVQSTWSSTRSRRGKRQIEVKMGVYVVEHIATGKLYVGRAVHVSKAVDSIILDLCENRLGSPKFQIPFNHDPDLKLHEFPVPSQRHCKILERRIRESVSPAYLLTNPSSD